MVTRAFGRRYLRDRRYPDGQKAEGPPCKGSRSKGKARSEKTPRVSRFRAPPRLRIVRGAGSWSDAGPEPCQLGMCSCLSHVTLAQERLQAGIKPERISAMSYVDRSKLVMRRV